METFSKSKVFIIALVMMLALVFIGCEPASQVDGSPEPTMDTSPLSPTASQATQPTTTPSLTPGSSTASQEPSASPSPSAPTQTVIPAAKDFAPLDPGYSFTQNLSSMYKNSDYAIIATIEEELGPRNIMEGTELGKTLPNVILSHFEYRVTVNEVFKSSKTAPIEVDSEIVLSQPFEIKMKTSEPLAREEPFTQLEVGESYVFLLSYEDYYMVYNPSATEPNILKIEGDNLRYITGVSSFMDLWKMVNGGETMTMKAFRDIAK
ncbi:MAG: hypothetical protein ACOX8S_07470 [Christensenellales bacterium]|jgi:hypothetical protein